MSAECETASMSDCRSVLVSLPCNARLGVHRESYMVPRRSADVSQDVWSPLVTPRGATLAT